VRFQLVDKPRGFGLRDGEQSCVERGIGLLCRPPTVVKL
jgi:hypothetical protein